MKSEINGAARPTPLIARTFLQFSPGKCMEATKCQSFHSGCQLPFCSATPESLPVIPVCRATALDPMVALRYEWKSEGAVGIELIVVLKGRKLLIPRKTKSEKNHKNAEPRYTGRTRRTSKNDSRRDIKRGANYDRSP